MIAELERDPKPFEEWHAAFQDAQAKVSGGWSESDSQPSDAYSTGSVDKMWYCGSRRAIQKCRRVLCGMH